VTEVFCVCVRTSHCTEVLKFLSLLFPHENWPPSFFLSALQIVLFSLQHSFPPSCRNECRVALSTCWGLKACGIRLFTANEFKDSITASTEQARHSNSCRARCRCVIERNRCLKGTYWAGDRCTSSLGEIWKDLLLHPIISGMTSYLPC